MENINKKEFNKAECDWKYGASCASDTNCIYNCNMKCPYIEEEPQIILVHIFTKN